MEGLSVDDISFIRSLGFGQDREFKWENDDPEVGHPIPDDTRIDRGLVLSKTLYSNGGKLGD